MQTDDPTVAIMVKLPKSLKQALEARAHERSQTLSQVTREALALALDIPVGASNPLGNRKHKDTAARRSAYNASQRDARRLLRTLSQTNPSFVEGLLSEKTA